MSFLTGSWIPFLTRLAKARGQFSQFVLLIFGGISVALGGFFSYHSHFSHPQYSYLPPDDVWHEFLGAFPSESYQDSKVVIEVSGAVEKPGVYSVSSGARWQDALLQAGGFSKTASQRYIHQEINLAKTLSDQEKIYIPFQGEEESKSASDEPQPLQKSVNQITQKELEEIPGIGAARAEKFLSGVPYSSADDVAKRSGLPESVRTELLNLYSI